MSTATYSSDDLTAKARIRQAALELIAAEGFTAASMRRIGERAGVSASLVQHHFQSKQGVADEVSEWVLTRLLSVTEGVSPTDDPAETVRHRMQAFDDMLRSTPALGPYIRRSMLEGSDVGGRWFATWVAESEQVLRDRQRAGTARQSPDIRAEATMLVTLTLAPLLLKPLIYASLDADIDDDEMNERWRHALAALLTSPLFEGGPEGYAPASASAPRRRRTHS